MSRLQANKTLRVFVKEADGERPKVRRERPRGGGRGLPVSKHVHSTTYVSGALAQWMRCGAPPLSYTQVCSLEVPVGCRLEDLAAAVSDQVLGARMAHDTTSCPRRMARAHRHIHAHPHRTPTFTVPTPLIAVACQGHTMRTPTGDGPGARRAGLGRPRPSSPPALSLHKPSLSAWQAA